MALTVSVVNMSLHVKTKNSEPFRGLEKSEYVCVCVLRVDVSVVCVCVCVREPFDKDMKI